MPAEEDSRAAKQAKIRAVQSEHRRRLVESWPIGAGSRVLEIGCGQGDTTAALAAAVGPKGRVLAVDPAPAEYGSPLTLGQATALIASSELGRRVEFRLAFDLLAAEDRFEDGQFDAAVLAHSSWYFGSSGLLERTLRTARRLARTLCFAEWNLEPRSMEQAPHLLAVLIQGQTEAFKTESLANVRTPMSREQARALITRAGWAISGENSIPTDDMQDADWEIAVCLSDSAIEALGREIPARLAELIATQIDVLRAIARPSGNRSLPCYSIVADQA